MEGSGSYINLENLEVYQLAREYGRVGWEIFEPFDWQKRKIIGDQMIRSIDSVGANIAEGYGRFHYLDKIKFYYNSRGSLLESKHWLDVMRERKIVDAEVYKKAAKLFDSIFLKLNNLINSQYNRKSNIMS